MTRLLTAAVGVPAALAAFFYFSDLWLFAAAAFLFTWAAWEFVRIARYWAPDAPLVLVMVTVPAAAYVLTFGLPVPEGLAGVKLAVAGSLLLAGGSAFAALYGRTPVEQTLAAVGALAFGTVYFAVPIASLVHLRRLGEPEVLLVLGIVWLGDAGAYYAGKSLGRHKMTPVVSPNKTWEGAAAALLVSLAAAAAWSLWQLGSVDWRLLPAAAATSVAAQTGDLVESMFKRGAHVKDSGHSLPGHGGWFDRVDALMLGAPVMLVGLWLLGPLR